MRKTILAVVIFVSLGLAASILTRGHRWGDDFASYIMQAESILNGTMDDFIEHNSLTIFESSYQLGPVAYPWGFPLLLTPVLVLKGIHPLALKLPGLFFYAGFLLCLYLLMKIRLTQWESLLITCLFAFNPLLLNFLDQILSDIPFLFFSTLALLLMIRNEEPTALENIALGFAIACAFFIRVTGILLLASFIASECLAAWNNRNDRGRIKKRIANVVIVSVTFGLLWLLYTLVFPGGGESYFAQYQQFEVATAFNFMRGYIEIFRVFFGVNTFWMNLYYLLFLIALIGAWTKRRDDLVFILFYVFWMLLLASWPAWQGTRFIFPLLPIFIYFTFQGANFALGKLPAKYARTGQWVVYGFWTIIAIFFLYNSTLSAVVNLQNGREVSGPFDPFTREVYEYIREKTPPDSVIIFFKPRLMRLMTDHDSIASTECDRILKGDYLVLSKKVEEYLQIPPDKINSCNLPLNKVLSNRRFVVYHIQK